MLRVKQAEIKIDDFQPRNDGYIQAYKGTWKEHGMIATAWLDTVEPDQALGSFIPSDIYEVSSTYERALGGPARGQRQEKIGADLARELRERMRAEMQAAGWQVVAQTKEGRDLWQYQPAHVPLTQYVTPTQITVTRTAREVRFTCKVCGKDTTQFRMPGPQPRYCSDTCKTEGERAKTRERVTRLRQRRKKTEAIRDLDKRIIDR